MPLMQCAAAPVTVLSRVTLVRQPAIDIAWIKHFAFAAWPAAEPERRKKFLCPLLEIFVGVCHVMPLNPCDHRAAEPCDGRDWRRRPVLLSPSRPSRDRDRGASSHPRGPCPTGRAC